MNEDIICRPLIKTIIDGKEFIEISRFAANNIKPGSYLINKNAEIYSLISNKYINPSMAANGYLVVNLKLNNGNSQIFYVHRIYMITFNFIYNYENMQVNHIDGIKTHNYDSNLEWVTLRENVLHAKENGLLCTGENCSWSKLTENQVKEICQIIQDKSFESIAQIAELYNCSVTTIGDIARGKTWTNVSKDYNLGYDCRTKLFDEEVHFICKVFSENRDKSFQYLYYLIIFYLNLEDTSQNRKRILKIYKKDPNSFSYITSHYIY